MTVHVRAAAPDVGASELAPVRSPEAGCAGSCCYRWQYTAILLPAAA
ncbi:hypothetical protein [Streptomyces sp. NBC_00829]|nr:hypothetical protein OG293_02280 [Streptomyces sp. NBC_00829]